MSYSNHVTRNVAKLWVSRGLFLVESTHNLAE